MIEEIVLPFVLTYRVARGQLTLKLAWWLLETWWPCKFYRRRKAFFRVWRARRYRGNDEFHHSLRMDGLAMLEMTKPEREAYRVDLMRRRERLHAHT